MKPEEIQKVVDAKWQELLKKYEDEKKKDPDFAVPPNEDQLPKAMPARLWQIGDQQWQAAQREAVPRRHHPVPLGGAGNDVHRGVGHADRHEPRPGSDRPVLRQRLHRAITPGVHRDGG